MSTPDPVSIEDSEIIMTDRRAHERIDVLEYHYKTQQGLIEAQSETLRSMSDSLIGIARNLESFTAIFQTLKGIRAFIVWASPVCLAVLAVWTMLDDIRAKLGL